MTKLACLWLLRQHSENKTLRVNAVAIDVRLHKIAGHGSLNICKNNEGVLSEYTHSVPVVLRKQWSELHFVGVLTSLEYASHNVNVN